MKYTAIIALFLASNVDAIKMKEAQTSEAEESTEAEAALQKNKKKADFDAEKKGEYDYAVEDQNFNGILGMLGTPTSMTTQLHTMFNQIHFNERVMRQIREIVNDVPDLVETICADEGGDCACAIGNNMLYGATTDEGKVDYMLGFSEQVAVTDVTNCSGATFGEPLKDYTENKCWCQTWEATSAVNSTSNAQVFSADQMQGLASLAQT